MYRGRGGGRGGRGRGGRWRGGGGRGRGGYRDSRPMHRREGTGTTDWDIEDSRTEREVHVVPDRGVWYIALLMYNVSV